MLPQSPRFMRRGLERRSMSASWTTYGRALTTVWRTIGVSVVVLTLSIAAAQSNVALAYLGATTGDNGHFSDAGYAPQPSRHVIDGDWSTYWAGLMGRSPQMVWVNLPGMFQISRITIGELPEAYMRTGLVEYFNGSSWQTISWIDKQAPGILHAFPPVYASAVRLTIYSVRAPSSWYNRVAAITALEVYGVPVSSGPQPPLPQSCYQGRLGVDISDALVVTGFRPGSPAQYAGVRHGDVLVSINGIRVRSVAHAQELVAGPPGAMVRLVLWRESLGRTQTYSVFLECLQ